jgi:hypothetical protein
VPGGEDGGETGAIEAPESDVTIFVSTLYKNIFPKVSG